MSEISLAQMRQGEEGVVVSVHGGYGLFNKLESLGIRNGTRIRKISSHFMKGPVIIQSGNTQLAIGFGMASRVMVRKIR